jgi:hypothetical protein
MFGLLLYRTGIAPALRRVAISPTDTFLGHGIAATPTIAALGAERRTANAHFFERQFAPACHPRFNCLRLLLSRPLRR